MGRIVWRRRRKGQETVETLKWDQVNEGQSSMTQSIANFAEHSARSRVPWGIQRSSSTKGHSLEGVMLSEASQTEKGRYCVISLMCGI